MNEKTRKIAEDMAAKLILLNQAAKRETINYLSFANEMNRVLQTNRFTRYTVSSVLGRLQQAEAEQPPEERLLFSSLVVLKETDSPSGGFWECAEMLGYYNPAYMNQRAFWEYQIEKCFSSVAESDPNPTVLAA